MEDKSGHQGMRSEWKLHWCGPRLLCDLCLIYVFMQCHGVGNSCTFCFLGCVVDSERQPSHLNLPFEHCGFCGYKAGFWRHSCLNVHEVMTTQLVHLITKNIQYYKVQVIHVLIPRYLQVQRSVQGPIFCKSCRVYTWH